LRHLFLLKSEGVVTERLSGKTRFFRFTKTLKAQAVVKLLAEWEK
jgi:DNA-binding transcriptional ArsR family regulator